MVAVRCLFVVPLAVCLALASSAPAAAPDDALVREVSSRLLAVMDPTPGTEPPLFLTEGSGLRSSVRLRREGKTLRPVVRVSPDLMRQVVRGDADVLAFVLANRLAHVALGHPLAEESAEGGSRAFDRAAVEAASWEGVRLMLRAGFSLRRGLRGVHRFQDADPRADTFDGPAADVPSWDDRLARFDREQPALAQSMSAFRAGAAFLAVEYYALAMMCFMRRSRVRFPSAPTTPASAGGTFSRRCT
jgi:hypothetical protein